VTEKAERTDVVQIALAAALGYGQDVVRIPEAAAAGDGLHPIEAETGGAGWASGALESSIGGDAVDMADGAAATIARKDLIAEIAGVGAETPLVDAVIAAEGAATFGKDLKLAPAAERQTVRALRKSVARSAATGQSAGDEHALPA
jgi:hypothetical protein